MAGSARCRVVRPIEYEHIGMNDKYTYEAVLYENGDILFQYKSMIWADDGGYWCGYVGIEDAEGLDLSLIHI